MSNDQTTQAAETTSAPAPAVTNVGTGAKAKRAAAKRPSKPKVVKADGKKAKMPKTSKKPGKAKVKAITGNRLVPADLTKYHVDKEKKTANGNPSVDSNDKVAVMLRGKDLESVYQVVAKQTEETVPALKAKYKHLNVGMQRMNLGNKLRGVLNAK